jgi:K+-transporting ATPase KdpF subunit
MKNGYFVCGNNSCADSSYAGVYSDVRKGIGRDFMPIIYWIGGIISLLLFIYLLIALLKPEIFS